MNSEKTSTMTEIPAVMKAAQASMFGDASQVVTVSTQVPTPTIPPKNNYVVIRVHACSLSPGDYRMLSGCGDLIKKPPAWPYIPGGDVSGTIVAISSKEQDFKVGDRVVGTWGMFGIGGLAEYTQVHTKYVTKIPDCVDYLDAAALVDSSANALLAIEEIHLKKDDTLLLLGGSGGVGTSIIQFAKNFIGVKTIITTSTDHELLKHELGVTEVINYKLENWWESKSIKEYMPFDVVIDCAEGSTAWEHVNDLGIVKPGVDGGRFLAVVGNEWHIEMHSIFDMISWFSKLVGRCFWSCWHKNKAASYKMMFPSPRRDSLKRLWAHVENGHVKVVIDKQGPHELSTEGIREAFNIMVNRKGHGKVVVKILDH